MLKMSQIESIRDAWDSGKSISEIAEALKIDRKTVRKYLNQEDFSPEKPRTETRGSRLAPYKSEIMLESTKKVMKKTK